MCVKSTLRMSGRVAEVAEWMSGGWVDESPCISFVPADRCYPYLNSTPPMLDGAA